MKVWCWLWGHTVDGVRTMRTLDNSEEWLLFCRRCFAEIDVVPISAMLPENIRRRGDKRCTIGPLRKVAEYLRCQLGGHVSEWEPEWVRLMEHNRCQDCKQVFGERLR